MSQSGVPIVSDVAGAVSDVGSAIDDAIIAPVVKAGSQLDDFVNTAIPGGWLTVALAAGAYYGAEAIAAGNAAESAALAEGATAAEAAAAGEAAATAAQTAASGATVYPVAAPAAIIETPIAAGTVGIPAAAGAVTGAEGLMSAYDLAASNIDPALLETMSQEQVTQYAINSPYYAAAQSNIDPALLEGMSAAEVANTPVLTSGVLPETLAATSTLSVKDALDAARLGQSLLGSKQTPTYNPQMPQAQLSGAVDYSQLLGLLSSGKARTPSVYQSLLGTRYG